MVALHSMYMKTGRLHKDVSPKTVGCRHVNGTRYKKAAVLTDLDIYSDEERRMYERVYYYLPLLITHNDLHSLRKPNVLQKKGT